MICRVYGINEKSQFQKASWVPIFFFFFSFFLAEPILSTEKNEVAFSTTKSIIILNYAEQIPKKSENIIKFKVQEIESLVDCSALRWRVNDD